MRTTLLSEQAMSTHAGIEPGSLFSRHREPFAPGRWQFMLSCVAPSGKNCTRPNKNKRSGGKNVDESITIAIRGSRERCENQNHISR